MGDYLENNGFRTLMQCDGNLVTYTSTNGVHWTSRSQIQGGYVLLMNTNGDLQLLGAYGTGEQWIVWHSNTANNPAAFLYLSPAGSLQVLRGPYKGAGTYWVLWQSG